jgi:DNA-binding winged helix-turn-helix (wHTH) protein
LAPYSFDRTGRLLVRDGQPIEVGQRGVALFRALAAAKGEVLTKSELMSTVWPDVNVEEANLTVQVASLRKALGPRPEGGDWIATVPRVGYRLVMPTSTVA